jgi:hypothetical protein
MTSQRDIIHIFEKLRGGAVPERAVETFAVGIEPQRDEIKRQLELLRHGEGAVKFLRGGYGCGKTFMARLALLDAQAQGFATSFVVVSDNDLHFHRFDDVYRKVMTELGTSSCQRGALGDILDRWIAKQEAALIELGNDRRRRRLRRQGPRAPQDQPRQRHRRQGPPRLHPRRSGDLRSQAEGRGPRGRRPDLVAVRQHQRRRSDQEARRHQG